jgi:Ca2+-binding RTX toxin-like protein
VATLEASTTTRQGNTFEDGISTELLITHLITQLIERLHNGRGILNGASNIIDSLAAITDAAVLESADPVAPIQQDVILQQDVVSNQRITVMTGSWSGGLLVNQISRGSSNSDILTARQIDFGVADITGSMIFGGSGADVISGRAGWDILDGGDGDDLIHGGNGRDILTGGAGRDELHGDFGWNTYRPERDGVPDLIAIKSDQFLYNWLYGKAGNNADGLKCDIIEGLDALDRICIIGVDSSQLSFRANISIKGVSGIGIYGAGALEAIYTGGDLTLNQIMQMTSGAASTDAMTVPFNGIAP